MLGYIFVARATRIILHNSTHVQRFIQTGSVHNISEAVNNSSKAVYNRSEAVHYRTTMSSDIQFHTTASGERIAYERIEGSTLKGGGKTLTLLYVPGYGSGKDGDKAMFLRKVAADYGCSYVRYDPTGLGASTGKPFVELEFKDWLESAEEMLEKVGGDQTILVGSSMGGWISLLLAAQPRLKHRIKGIVLIAPALNFYMKFYTNLISELSQEVVERIERGEIYDHVDKLGNSRLIRKSMFTNTVQFEIHGEIDVEVPVTILHGLKDDVVDPKGSLAIVENLKSKDVELIYTKEGSHRFQDEKELETLQKRVVEMLNKIR